MANGSPDSAFAVDSAGQAGLQDDVSTIAAIAILAFILTDVAHECIGHGLGYWIAGGRAPLFTTTRLIGEVHGAIAGRIFSAGGPFGNLMCGTAAYVAMHARRQWPVRAKAFLWLTLTFNLFWATGYMIFSAAANTGDYVHSIEGVPPAWLWRAVLLVLGAFLYRASMRMAAREMHGFVRTRDRNWPRRVRRIAVVSYFAAGVIASAGAILDPRGISQVYLSGALVSFGAMVGLLRLPELFSRTTFAGQSPVEPLIGRSMGWIAAAAIGSAIFVFGLGPGLRINL